MTSVVLRNIARAFAQPADVPPVVDDVTLAAALAAGRPEGEAGLLTVDGVGCPTIAAGAGPAVLCVHGLGHDAWDFAPFFVRCSKAAALMALDLPGFGLADKPPTTSWTLSLLVDALLAAAAAAPAPPVVVASSLGGHVALLAAIKNPHAFKKLLLLAPGGLVDIPAHMQAMLRGYYAVEQMCGRSEMEIVGNSHRIFAKAGHPLDDALAARKLAVHRSPRKREFAVVFSQIIDDVFRHVLLERLLEVRVPTLIVSGERDVIVPTSACANAARRMSAQFVSLPEVGHCPHLEVADEFAALAMRFIHGDNDAAR